MHRTTRRAINCSDSQASEMCIVVSKPRYQVLGVSLVAGEHDILGRCLSFIDQRVHLSRWSSFVLTGRIVILAARGGFTSYNTNLVDVLIAFCKLSCWWLHGEGYSVTNGRCWKKIQHVSTWLNMHHCLLAYLRTCVLRTLIPLIIKYNRFILPLLFKTL